MRIALLGAPGAGKDVFAEALAARYKIVCIDTAVLFADAVRAARRSRKAAALDVVMAVLENRVRERDCKRGFVLHDFPRDIPAAQSLDTMLGVAGKTLQIVINLTAADKVLLNRMTGRMKCKNCAIIYNRYSSPPQKRNTCDVCGHKVLAAGEARAGAAADKIREYHNGGDALLAYYKAQHKLRSIVLADTDAHTLQQICALVDLEIHPLEVAPLAAGDAADMLIGGQPNRATTKTTTKKPAAKTTTKKPAAKKPSAKKTTAKKPRR